MNASIPNPPMPGRRWRSLRVPLAIGFVASLAIVAVGLLFYHQRKRALVEEIQQELSAIADLKLGQIAQWREERLTDARLLSADPLLVAAVQRWSADGGNEGVLREWLSRWQGQIGCKALVLVDAQGRGRLAGAPFHNLDFTDLSGALQSAAAAQKPVLSDLHRDTKDGSIHFDLIAPIPSAPGAGVSGAAFIITVIDPAFFLYPLIQSWPTPSPSAETLLLQRDGGQLVYLNELRHRKGTALSLRMPLDAAGFIGARALREPHGVLTGVDYRGVQSIAATRPIAGTGWVMVAKVDEEEVLKPVRHLLALVLSFVLLGVAGSGTGVVLWQRHRSSGYYRHLWWAAEENVRLGLSLAAERERLSVTLRSIGDGVIATDAEGRVQLMNAVSEGLTGWTEDEARGRPLPEVFRIISAVSREPCENPVSKVLALEGIVGLANHTSLLARDGTERAIADSAAPIRDGAGRVLGVVLVFRDVTEAYRAEASLHEAQALLQASLDHSQAGIAIADAPDGKLRYINDAALRIRGGDRDAIVRGIGIDQYVASWRLFDLDGRPLAKEEVPLARALLFGEASHRDFFVRRDDGENRTVSANAAPIRDPAGNLIAAIVIFLDVTDQRKNEAALVSAQKLESIGMLAGGLAHDFNNLLAGLFINLGIVQERLRRGDTGGLAKPMESIMEVLHRARSLTNQLLTFSKGGDPHRKSGDLVALLRRTLAFCLSGSTLTQEWRLGPGLWHCLIDENQIAQVVENLVINARQAMPGGGKLTVEAANVPPGGAPAPLGGSRYVRFSLTDEGGGIPPENLGRIFDPFFTTKPQGSGLGLATSHAIIQKHGGAIRVDSAPGRGATFHIYLPASEPEEKQEAAAAGAPKVGCRRILIMDDVSYLRTASREQLEILGHRVSCAADGEEALRLAREAVGEGDPFIFAILDLTVPGGLGGKEVVYRLRQIDPAIKAIASSGYSDDPVMADPTAFGFAGRLSKPYTMGELQTLLSSLAS